MKVYKQEVKRNPWADRVIVARLQNGRWLILHGRNTTEVPANSFASWDEAKWTGNAWANEEHEKYLSELYKADVDEDIRLNHADNNDL
jgi:hypothetical protein